MAKIICFKSVPKVRIPSPYLGTCTSGLIFRDAEQPPLKSMACIHPGCFGDGGTHSHVFHDSLKEMKEED